PAPPDEPPRNEGISILLAEDNPVNRKIVLRLLEKQGYRVTCAEDGREALAALEQRVYDLALMDVEMPKLNGLAACEAVREREKVTGSHIPIIAMTAHAMKGDQEKCLLAGMDDYVSKPIRPEDLLGAIRKALTARRGGAA